MKIGYLPQKSIQNNVSSFLEEHAKNKPTKVAFYFLSKDSANADNFAHERMYYKDFNDKVASLSGGLYEYGIRKGDRIIVFIPISPELYITIVALQRIGAIPVLIDSWSRQEQLTLIVHNSEPSGIIAPSMWLNLFKVGLDSLDIGIRISSDENNSDKNLVKLTDLLKREKNKIVAVNKNDSALITYTTGSSGVPKGVNRTHRFLAAQHYALKRLFPYKAYDIDLPVFPVFALNNIASGITTVIPGIDISKPNPKDSEILISQALACQVNTMTLAPSSFRHLAFYCNEKGILLQGLSRVLTGGAPISETDILSFVKIAPNSKNWILYGSTEVEPIACIEAKTMLVIKSPEWSNKTKIGVNVGKIDRALNHKLICMEDSSTYKLDDIKDIEIVEGKIGELIVAGEHVCERYYKNKEAIRRTKIKDGSGTIWHRTGDLARIDKNGFLWIVGRKHNIIRYGKEYFFPVRPEIILKDLPEIINAAYLNSNSDNKTKIIAVVTLKKETKEIKEKCHKKINKIFKKEKFPLDDVFFIDEIPMDVRHHSKVDYNKLRQKLHDIFA